ncbi:diguanylate cyclase [Arcobacter sp. AHV-9/2010]|uniref:sensor domain-containing diguanylate cyclase n=1 Tax=Arcobacter sp. AHV-9/2010 TaxID=2021861 RepID=UPI00100BF280|nr:diguanylate cyclase [Arcobacter sp. CECT 9299]RXJ96663.1 diguanylate cyclase [Arcobacter sp. CECT 9299]
MFANKIFIKTFTIFLLPLIIALLLNINLFYSSSTIIENIVSIVLFIFIFVLFVYSFLVLKNMESKQEKRFLDAQKHQNIYKTLNLLNKMLPKLDKKHTAFSQICDILSKNKNISFNFIYDIDKKELISQKTVQKEYLENRATKKDFVSETLVSQIIKSGESLVVNTLKDDKKSIFYGKTDEFKLNSLLAIPIKKFDKTVGILAIYSHFQDFFDEDIKNIFEKLVLDITALLEKLELKEQKKRQEEELKLTSYAFEESFVPMIITDKRNNIIKANHAFLKIMGYERADILGKNPRIFKTAHQDFTSAKKLWETLLSKGYWSGEVYNRKANGEIIALKGTITVVKNSEGQTTNFIGQYMDISEQKDKEKVLQYQATHDNLTGLPNRLLLTDRIEHAITRTLRHKIYGGLIFIDLDNFKEVNDTLGHDIGDVLLITVAHKIKGCVRDEDTVARIGGDEFIVLIDNVGNNSDDARKNINFIAQKIKDSLNSITHIRGHINVSTPSIGITLFHDASVSVQDIIKQADTAMYSAKKQGKNSIEFF